jgi:hypothetical protein
MLCIAEGAWELIYPTPTSEDLAQFSLISDLTEQSKWLDAAHAAMGRLFYLPESVRDQVEADRERLFAHWAVGRPEGWSCDSRTKDLVCLEKWLTEELAKICANQDDRRTQLRYFNRCSRAEKDLFELASRTVNLVLSGFVEQGRVPHHRWG